MSPLRSPRPSRRRSARGFTLVEGLVALVVLFLSLGILWNVWSGANRQGDHIERGSELMQAATLIQEVLSWDLLRSLPVTAMEDRALERGVSGPSLVLPFYAGYEGSAEKVLHYRELEYRWDSERKVLLRSGEPIVQGNLDEVRFRWSTHRPTMLEVLLVGRKGLGSKAPRFVIRLPAPEGTDSSRHWKLAAQHRGATVTEAPVPQRGAE